MSLIETEETNKFTFEPFAAHPFYTEVNRALVKQALAKLASYPQDKNITIVDIACGTGAISRLIIEEMQRLGRLSQLQLIGVDPSAEALRRAQKSQDEMNLDVKTQFIQGDAEDLPDIIQHADMAFFCNAIHLIPDKRTTIQKVSSILGPQGIFACNSAFYEGTYVPGSERFYRTWTRRAVGWLRKQHPESRLSKNGKATAMQWLTREDYISHFQDSGFAEVETEQKTVDISLDAWKDLGQYWLFIEGALPGIPLAQAAKALEYAVYEAGNELGLTEVPRTWLQIVGVKGS